MLTPQEHLYLSQLRGQACGQGALVFAPAKRSWIVASLGLFLATVRSRLRMAEQLRLAAIAPNGKASRTSHQPAR